MNHTIQKNQLKKARMSNVMRNLNAEYDKMSAIIEWPQHKQMLHKVENMHEKGGKQGNVYDPYHWVANITRSQEEDFKIAEKQFTKVMLAKYDNLEKQMKREHEHFSQQSIFNISANIEPLKVGEWIYYRKADNPADAMSLYRFPVEDLQRYGFKLGQVPYLKSYETYSQEHLDILDEERRLKWEELE